MWRRRGEERDRRVVGAKLRCIAATVWHVLPKTTMAQHGPLGSTVFFMGPWQIDTGAVSLWSIQPRGYKTSGRIGATISA